MSETLKARQNGGTAEWRNNGAVEKKQILKDETVERREVQQSRHQGTAKWWISQNTEWPNLY